MLGALCIPGLAAGPTVPQSGWGSGPTRKLGRGGNPVVALASPGLEKSKESGVPGRQMPSLVPEPELQELGAR